MALPCLVYNISFSLKIVVIAPFTVASDYNRICSVLCDMVPLEDWRRGDIALLKSVCPFVVQVISNHLHSSVWTQKLATW